MDATGSIILAALFAATLLWAAASPTKFIDPPSPCLMLQGTIHGQGIGVKKGYEPKTCIT